MKQLYTDSLLFPSPRNPLDFERTKSSLGCHSVHSSRTREIGRWCICSSFSENKVQAARTIPCKLAAMHSIQTVFVA